MCIKIVGIKANKGIEFDKCDQDEDASICAFHEKFVDIFVKFENNELFHDKLTANIDNGNFINHCNKKYPIKIHKYLPLLYIEVPSDYNIHPVFSKIFRQFGMIQ